MLVDFFIAGVQKGGTTALDHFLRDHPSIEMARRKEVHFFDNERLDWNAPDYAKLHKHFSRWRRLKRGEATAIYTFWPPALTRLHRYNPHAKLIVLFRHPTFRAFSQWRMERKRGRETLSFADAIGEVGRRRVKVGELSYRVFSYVERGFYAPQVKALQDLFPPSQLLFLKTDDLWNEPHATLKRVHEFLGVQSGPSRPRLGRLSDLFRAKVPTAQQVYVAPLLTQQEAIPAETRTILDHVFAADIAMTAARTGLDLSAWLEPDYSEPMQMGDNPIQIGDEGRPGHSGRKI